MTSQDVLKTYQGANYVGLPQAIIGTELIYKYKDPIQFVEFLEEVHQKGLRKSSQNSSMNSGNWSGASSVEEAFKIYRESKYDTENSKRSSNLILKMRQGVQYKDAGDDISIPEYLASNREYFIEFQNRNRKKRPVLDYPIFINLACNANVDEEKMKIAANIIINKLYQYQIRTPKIVICYLSDRVANGNPMYTFIDVPYFDFNSLSRFCHTSTFRRIEFIGRELVRNLSYGYGSTVEFPIATTLHDVIQITRFTGRTEKEIGEMMDKIITQTFNKSI